MSFVAVVFNKSFQAPLKIDKHDFMRFHLMGKVESQYNNSSMLFIMQINESPFCIS